MDDIYKTIFNSVNDGIVITNIDGHFLEVNQITCDDLGYSKEELLQMNVKDIIPLEFRDTLRERITEKIACGGGIFESQCVCKDGSLEQIELNLRPIKYKELPAVLVVIRNITERKKLETKNIEDNLRRRIFIEQSSDGIVVLDNNGKVYEANEAFARMLGYSLKEISSLHVWDWDAQLTRNQLEHLQNTSTEKGYHVETTHRRKDGTLFDVDITANAAIFNDQKLSFCVCRDITERKRVEMQLRTAQSVGNVGSWEIDFTSHLVAASEEARKIYGIEDNKEYTNEYVRNLALPEYHQMLSDSMNDLITKNIRYDVEFKIRRVNDGEIRDIHSVAEYFADRNVAIGIIQDITERKESENALKEREEKYHLLADNTLDCIWILGLDLVFSYVNPAITKILGFTPDEWIGSKLSDHCDEVNFRKMMSFIQLEMEKTDYSEGIIFQTEVFHKKGYSVHVEIIGKVITDDDGKPLAMQGTTRDITSRVRSENALKESEECFRIMYENVPGGTMIIGEDYLIEDVNQRTCEITGYKKEELIGQLCDIVCPKGSLSKKCPIWVDGLDGFQGMDTAIKCKNGTKTPILKNSKRIFIEGKQFILENFQDISESKSAEEAIINSKIRAEEANRTKSEFLTTMSHELRTPLNAIIGYSDILLDGTFGEANAQQTKSLKHISNSGKHLLKLINDILDISKIESGKMELNYEEVFVNDIFVNVMDIVSPLARKKNIEIEAQVTPDNLLLNADKVRIKQILFNLASNAVKFTHEGGQVLLEAHEQGNVAKFSIKDTGIGISAEDIEKLFLPFQQIDSTISRSYNGTGLGLSLVKQFVEMHGGEVSVESELGEGSRFTFSIPI